MSNIAAWVDDSWWPLLGILGAGLIAEWFYLRLARRGRMIRLDPIGHRRERPSGRF